MTDRLVNRVTDKRIDGQARRPVNRPTVWSGGRSQAGEALFMWLASVLSKYTC